MSDYHSLTKILNATQKEMKTEIERIIEQRKIDCKFKLLCDFTIVKLSASCVGLNG